MPTLTLTAASPTAIKTDALVVATTADGSTARPLLGPDWPTAASAWLEQTLAALGAAGTAGEVLVLAAGDAVAAGVVIAVGVGRDASDLEALRRAAGVGLRRAAGRRSVALALPVDDPGQLDAVAQGALLGNYAFDSFRASTAGDRKEPVRTLTICTSQARSAAAKATVSRAEVLATAVGLARDLVNTPPSHLHPADLAEQARTAADGLPLDVEIMDEKALRKKGFGGILGVGQGSAHPPRLTRVAYRPAMATRHLALIGKGITFDSGGISIKPALHMDVMKSDMGGAAAVLAAVVAIARLGLPIAVTAWLPSAENMPSGTAQRPGDILTMYGGQTVEVLNTDAEGRLILADAIVRAGEESPDVMVDVATLTGAQLVALGSRVSGIMSNDEELRALVYGAAGRAGESMWPMPLPADLRPGLDSAVADLANIGDRQGGMLSAGLFLQEFVPTGTPWAHLDIAGPSFNEGDAYGYTPKGGTGASVRTLVQLAEELAADTS